mmetsp:Transcript_18248/g.55039  ORF Transcript_18248/g.55039 Transcript_18248/m.55039 type:complete len:106 (-) Transcript_18248:208-525(-)|eukprot:scaffold174344_cov32-Tisochrysis_lutea.AAC.6
MAPSTASDGDSCRSMDIEKTMQKAACNSPTVRRAHSKGLKGGRDKLAERKTYGASGPFPNWNHFRLDAGNWRNWRSRAASAAAAAMAATVVGLKGVAGSDCPRPL